MFTTRSVPSIDGLTPWSESSGALMSADGVFRRTQTRIEDLHELPADQFEAAQSFIRQRYHDEYQALLHSYMPRIFVLTDGSGTLLGAVGIRNASESLFLECYLDQPVETLIANAQRCSVDRRSIIEVGQFAGISPGSTRDMICHLTAYLYRAGYDWVVFTGTRSLRNGFKRLGLAPHDLGAAQPDRLPKDDPNEWGSYYQHQPRVQYGYIPQGFHALIKNRNDLS